MKKYYFCCLLFSLSPLFAAPSRLKDLVAIKGVQENPIVGHGLIVGLNGTGDGPNEIVNGSLKRLFINLGLNPQQEIASKNVAAVIVTATLPPFARVGQKIDVKVSSIGDASSLAGGMLLVTPLKGGDGEVYAVASGALSIGGLGQGAKFATVGLIPSGASVEKELNLEFDKKQAIRLSLKNPDFTTAARVEKTINQELGGRFAIAKDATTIDLIIPPDYQRQVVNLMAIVENFTVNTDTLAQIVINERTGTIVAGGDITLKPVAIGHRDLSIQIGDSGKNKKDAANEKFYMLENGATLSDLVKSLNYLGVGPEDLISIFQALKKNGSLTGEIVLI